MRTSTSSMSLALTALFLALALAACATGSAAVLPSATEAQPLPDGRVTAWVTITPDNRMTIMFGSAEMGQGVSTSLPMIVVAELGAATDTADADGTVVERAPGVPPPLDADGEVVGRGDVVAEPVEVVHVVADLVLPVVAGHPGGADARRRAVLPGVRLHVEAVEGLRGDDRTAPLGDAGEGGEPGGEPVRGLAVAVEDEPRLGRGGGIPRDDEAGGARDAQPVLTEARHGRTR